MQDETFLKQYLSTIVANISISRCCRSPRFTSDNNMLFYDDYNNSILTFLMSEYW